MKLEVRSPWGRLPIFETVLAVFAVTAGFLIALRNIQTNGFWIDEVYSIHAATMPWWDMVLDRIRRGHQPLYFLGLKSWYELLPESVIMTQPEFYLRLPSLVFYCLLALILGLFLRRTVGLRVTLVTVALVSLHGLLLRQSIEVRMYALLTLIHGGIMLLWLAVLRRGPHRPLSRSLILGLVGLSGLGALIVPASHVGTLALLLATVILRKTWNPGDRAPMIRRALLPFLSGIVISLPGWIAHFALRYRREGALDPPAHGLFHGTSAITGMLLKDQNILDPSPWIAVIQPFSVVVGIALLVGCIVLWRRLGLLSRFAILTAFPLPLVIVCIGVLTWVRIRIDLVGAPRYFLPLIPWVGLATAVMLIRLRPMGTRLLVTGSLILLLTVSSTLTTQSGGMEFRKVALRLKQELQDGDRLAVIPHDVEGPLRIYLQNRTIPITGLWRFESDRPQIRRQIRELVTSETQRLILVSFRGNSSRFFKEMEPTLGPAKWPPWGQGFGNLDVLIWDKPTIKRMD